MTEQEYFFIEWLIIAKGMTQETFERLTPEQLIQLRGEHEAAKRSALIIPT